ncbi:hypothetical protein V5O48_006490 [Marasmius crinis-equi]|uniref:WD40 repeat-like protein n=1 Tax=Marasmius crinis-equi TaxID=585013 RepID=A0ABR3FJD6_9AGAR
MSTPPSQNPNFELFATLQGARDAVLSVGFSSQAKFISATGFNGVNIWSLDTLLPVVLPRKGSLPTKSRYIYSASAWVFFENDCRHVLLLGSLEGEIVAWDWNDKREVFEPTRPAVSTGQSQITSIDVFQPSFGGRARVAVGHESCQVSVWKLPPEGAFVMIFNIDLGFIPRTVIFDCLTNRIFAFAMTGSRVIQLSSKSGKVTWSNDAVPATMSVFSKSLCCLLPMLILKLSGFAALHQASEQIALSTARDLRTFRFPTCQHLQTLESSPPVVRFPKQIAFTPQGDCLVAGTDSGKAVVYEIKSGKAIQSLDYPKGGLVQTVTTCGWGESCYVAIAGSASQQTSEVIIWRKKVKPSTSSIRSGGDPAFRVNEGDVLDTDSRLKAVVPTCQASGSPSKLSRIVGLFILACAIGLISVYSMGYSRDPKAQIRTIVLQGRRSSSQSEQRQDPPRNSISEPSSRIGSSLEIL